MSSTSGLPWWVSPLQDTGWHSLHAYISEIIYRDSMYRDKSITNQNVPSWPMIGRIWSSPGHNQTFHTFKLLKS